MKKHFLALLLVVALCVCAFAVSANENPEPPATTKQYWSHLTIAEDGLTATGYCPHCCDSTDETVTWNKLTITQDSHKKLTEGGHFFLPEGGYFSKGAIQLNAAIDLVLHLNGQTYKRNPEGGNTTGAIYFGSADASISIVDDKAQEGSINGGGGSAINGNSKTGLTINLYSGSLLTEKAEARSGNGTVYMNGNGSTFEMFGGTVYGSWADRGGAIHAAQSNATSAETEVIIHDGLITGGNANYGGGIYLVFAHATIKGGTIENGIAGTNGGNVTVHGNAASLHMEGGIIKGGQAGSWGGNVGLMQTGTTFTMDGGTLDGTNASGAGENIGISKGAVTLNGGTLKNGKSDSIRVNSSVDASLTLNNVTFENFGTNPANFETVLMTGTWTGNAGSITIGNFNSTVNFDYTTSFADADNFEFSVGLALPQVTVDATYTGNGSLWAYIDGGTRKPCVVDGTALKLGGMTAFDAAGKETPVATLGGDSNVSYYKMYADGEFTLAGEVIVDMNNAVVDFKTNGNKLTVVDYRTDSGEVAKTTKFTVDNEEDLNIYGVNPLNGYQYICVKGEDGYWTSNRVQVTLDKVSIKTTQAGVYYTTTIKTNANVVPYIVSYGTAVSIAEKPTADFVNQESVLYTEYGMDDTGVDETTGNMALTTRSALIAEVVKKGAEDNDTRSATPIYANSFMIINTGAENIYVMADETFDLSLNDAMEKLDAKLGDLSDAQLPIAVEFYTKWLAQGAFVGIELPKLEEAAA